MVLKKIKEVTKKDKIENEEIRRRLGIKNDLSNIETQQFRWFLFTRMEETRLVKIE